MARRSARLSSSQQSQQSSPASVSQSSPAATGTKRKAESGASPSAKRSKKAEKEQITIEESMDIETNDNEPPKPAEKTDEELKEPEAVEESKGGEADEEGEDTGRPEEAQSADAQVKQSNGDAPAADAKVDELENENDLSTTASDDKEEETQEKKEQPKEDKKPSEPAQTASTSNGDNAVEAGDRDDKVPNSIMEKGILYFLYRGRVNIDSPDNVGDIARSYMILRPLPHGAALGDGEIGDDQNCRLIAIPKKTLPVSGKDKWIAFVETAKTSFKELKKSFMGSDNYETQTAGTRTTPAVTPAAEGVYAITTTGRESHIAYILTLPKELGAVQDDLGLRPKGSFVVSVKNPAYPGPANTNAGGDPGYSQEIQDKFRSLRWAPMEPAMLDYAGCQFLMIGEGEQGIQNATEQQAGDEKKDETPMQEMEKLEGEDELRVEHLNGEDAVYADLGTNAKNYPSLQTTW